MVLIWKIFPSVQNRKRKKRCFKERHSNYFTGFDKSLIFQLLPFAFDSWLGATESIIFGCFAFKCLDARSNSDVKRFATVSYFRASNPHGHFDFRSRFLCFQTANQRIKLTRGRVNSRMTKSNAYLVIIRVVAVKHFRNLPCSLFHLDITNKLALFIS